MLSLLPNTPPIETSHFFALLNIIADPAAAKKRLKELIAEAEVVSEAVAEARQKHIDTATMSADVENQLREARALAERTAAERREINEQATTVKRDLAELTAARTQFEEERARQIDAARNTTVALNERATAIAAETNKIAADRKDLDERTAALNKRIAKMQEFVSA